ncbi:MAG TPA: hypothetical protein VM009_05465 [Terriglobales bacterium]|nr:hypothetical protein [Terriglobales bacterium]
MYFPLLALLLFFADPQPVRTVAHHTITSAADPAITIKVDKDLRYVGSFAFTIKNVAGGERHIWVKADRNQRVQRMFILQFEGYFPGSPHRYNYSPRNITHLGANDYNSNGFLYDDTAYHRENPGNEAEGTRKFLEALGYKLDAEQLLYRFYRALPDADLAKNNRNEFLIFYLEPMKELGITMKETTERQDSVREKQVVAAARQRALKAFQVVKD